MLRGAVGDEVHAQLREGGAIDFRKLHLQQNFLGADRTESEDVDDFWRIGAGEFSGTLGDILGGNVSGENDRRARWRDRDLLIGENAVLFFGAGADVDVHAKVEAARTLQFIPDEKRNLLPEFCRGPESASG